MLLTYRDWCHLEGARPLGANRFWRSLMELDPHIDTGTTADNRNGYRVGAEGTPIVQGIRSITWHGAGGLP